MLACLRKVFEQEKGRKIQETLELSLSYILECLQFILSKFWFLIGRLCLKISRLTIRLSLLVMRTTGSIGKSMLKKYLLCSINVYVILSSPRNHGNFSQLKLQLLLLLHSSPPSLLISSLFESIKTTIWVAVFPVCSFASANKSLLLNNMKSMQLWTYQQWLKE